MTIGCLPLECRELECREPQPLAAKSGSARRNWVVADIHESIIYPYPKFTKGRSTGFYPRLHEPLLEALPERPERWKHASGSSLECVPVVRFVASPIGLGPHQAPTSEKDEAMVTEVAEEDNLAWLELRRDDPAPEAVEEVYKTLPKEIPQEVKSV